MDYIVGQFHVLCVDCRSACGANNQEGLLFVDWQTWYVFFVIVFKTMKHVLLGVVVLRDTAYPSWNTLKYFLIDASICTCRPILLGSQRHCPRSGFVQVNQPPIPSLPLGGDGRLDVMCCHNDVAAAAASSNSSSIRTGNGCVVSVCRVFEGHGDENRTGYLWTS